MQKKKLLIGGNFHGRFNYFIHSTRTLVQLNNVNFDDIKQMRCVLTIIVYLM